MRGPQLAVSLISLLLAAPLLAGCLQTATVTPAEVGPIPELVLKDVPSGARVEPLEGGLRVVWDGVALPFEETLTIPWGTTLVRASAEVADGQRVSITMRHAETERRRCNLAPVDAWDVPVLGRATCSGVTAMDRLPDQWIVRATSALKEAKLVEVELLATPLDGFLGQLDLGQLSQREHALKDTEFLMVPSFDGTPLRVEVTLPEGPGPWPTILWSSPYNHGDRAQSPTATEPGKVSPAAWTYFVNDWAQRGYAVVSADVRGYGESGGCVEVWGKKEQQDQVFLVNWIAEQGWSDGNVGFYGQSYVATTPVEAAVYAPEALKAIVIVAPVNNAYDDWHFGGVPNGENLLSPVAYQALTGVPALVDARDPLTTALNAANGLCDPTLAARSSDPRAIYDAFYEERNFSARAKDIKAAVLYTQGFEDSNVKSQMIPDFFNAITAPKLGLFGHWVHQHPTRADNEVLMLGWMDQYVKGKPVGMDRLPEVSVVTNAGTHRTDTAWPPVGAATTSFYPDFSGKGLGAEPGDGSATLLLDSATPSLPNRLPVGLPIPTQHTLRSAPLEAPLHFAGQGYLHLTATLQNAENGYVAAYLYEERDGESALVTWGMFNLAHRFGHDRYEPVKPMEVVRVNLPLLPTEWVFDTGATLRLVLRGAAVTDWAAIPPSEPGTLSIKAGADGTVLALPTVDGVTGVEPLPATLVR